MKGEISMMRITALAAMLAASAAHAQQSEWVFNGTASGTAVTVAPDGTATTASETMPFTASFIVDNGVMTSFDVMGNVGTGSSGYFGPGGEISPLYDAQGAVIGGEVQYSFNAPTGNIAFDINNGSISYFSEFGQSDGTVTYESLSGGGGWVDSVPELDWPRAVAALTMLGGLTLVLKSRARSI
jgi:hypothetical protein